MGFTAQRLMPELWHCAFTGQRNLWKVFLSWNRIHKEQTGASWAFCAWCFVCSQMGIGNSIIYEIRLQAYSQIIQLALQRNQKAPTYSCKLAQHQYAVNKNQEQRRPILTSLYQLVYHCTQNSAILIKKYTMKTFGKQLPSRIHKHIHIK